MIRSLARAVGAPLLLGAALLASAAALAAEPVKPVTTEGDVTVREFKFKTGETLPEVRLHYTTLGTPHRDAKGRVDNAILIMHGTGGTGAQFLRPQFSDVLFQPGGVLDPARYYIILPDDVGHGKSSKPSDGLHAHFPQYDYDDMVALEHQLVTRLGVNHLRLVMGTSMGCMHAFVWGETYPDAMDALMPLACLPQAIAGRNRLWRQMSIAAIKADPAWQGGEYKTQPKEGLRTAAALLSIAGSAPIQMQKTYPTREAADAAVEKILDVSGMEANDLIYQLDASRTYDPSPKLETIKAPVLWINSGDDFINPPELGLAEQLVTRIPQGQFVLMPASDQTHGHGSHTWAVLWQDKLADLLARTAPKN
ncbi:alpha/beta fold hydrolase [Nitrospirillum sp. BR 11163]|uniref:alpha/beta fold hydrolase n=1 Tax=Nitrospirillum sp. BR 11163 TaxID=3104323 RepID=UPI002AFE7B5D|nr:alpha/beta fold hydrolase [Nitrospirillum sp. BR 11163]MEA1674033.1 alpha/beta fold hydrolase [Nitrospirillum sp. BR 11163]